MRTSTHESVQRSKWISRAEVRLGTRKVRPRFRRSAAPDSSAARLRAIRGRDARGVRVHHTRAHGTQQIQTPFGNGNLCVGGGATGIARLLIELAGTGVLRHQLD